MAWDNSAVSFMSTWAPRKVWRIGVSVAAKCVKAILWFVQVVSIEWIGVKVGNIPVIKSVKMKTMSQPSASVRQQIRIQYVRIW